MSQAVRREKIVCDKCSRDKEYDYYHQKHVCPVCEIEWDAKVWDRVIMQKPAIGGEGE